MVNSKSFRRWFVACALSGFSLLGASLAWAFPASIQVVSKVSVGKNPKIVVQMSDAAEKAVITLKRDDGRAFTFPLGNLGSGAVKEIQLDGRVARHRYEGEMKAVVEGEEISSPLAFETVVARPITIQVSRKDLDLTARTLDVVTSREVSRATLTIIGLDGAAIEETSTEIRAWQKGKPISLSWKFASEDEIVHLEVRVEDEDGFFNASKLTPWSVHIPHEEVHFETGSAQIEATEEPKLEDSLEKIQHTLEKYSQIKGVQLFIAGHTDTQGGAASNLNLSRNRARAIAAWFLQRGLRLPVLYEGFGESALKVKTQDEVDEPRNRRVDYILSVEAPPLSRGSWKRLN